MDSQFQQIPSPCFVLEKTRLVENLELLHQVGLESGAAIILAFKGFALWGCFPEIRKYLSSATASSLNEARLGYEEMGTKVHLYAPAYLPTEMDALLAYASHISFNSLRQYEQYRDRVLSSTPSVSMGLRVNPEYSDVATALYNPASPDSRLGITADQLQGTLPSNIEGLHFHVLCESSAQATSKAIAAFEAKFGHLLDRLKWVNFGGGHLMTRKDYELELLIQTIRDFKTRYDLQVILEPGSAIAWEAGFLRTSVLDIVENGGVKTAIIDASITCHMPDCLEMPYRPMIRGAQVTPRSGQFRYRIGGLSCLAGDYLEAYGFDKELQIGQSLIFEDMMHYTMVKTNHFNGVGHPGIGILEDDQTFRLLKAFNYEDYRNRLS